VPNNKEVIMKKAKIDNDRLFLIMMSGIALILLSLLLISIIFNYLKNKSNVNEYEYNKVKEEVNTSIYDTRIEKSHMLIEIDRLSKITIEDTIRYYLYFDDGSIEISSALYNKFKEGDTIIIGVYRVYKNDKLKSTYYEYEGSE
jgi:hypothetical protein